MLPILVFSQNKLIMSGPDNWYPIHMYDEETDTISGIGYDIFMEICSRLGVEGEAKGGIPWLRLFYFLTIGDIDIINGAYYTSERNVNYLFTVPYLKNETRIFVLRGKEFLFNDLSDLKGYIGAKPRGAKYGDEFDSYAAENLILIEPGNKDNLILMLLNNRIDYFISDLFDVSYILNISGLNGIIIALSNPVNYIDVHMIFSKTSEGSVLFEKYNAELKKMIEDGTVDKMFEKYK